MKLSKQERIGVLIIAVILIIGLGVFFFVVPKFKEVGVSKTTLENKQVEYQAAIDKAATKDTLKDDIIAAYEEGRNLADMFFEEMTPYELDGEVRAFIQYCKDHDINILVEEMSVSKADVEALGVSFFEDEGGAEYDLKTYATQGLTLTPEEQEAQARRATLMAQLTGTQNVAASTASFTFTALSAEDYIKFIDIVNNYNKEENGKTMRKALTVNGLNVTYEEIDEEYDAIVEALEAEMIADSEDVLKEYAEEQGFEPDFGEKREDVNNNGGANDDAAAGDGNANDDDKEDDDKKKLGDCMESYSVVLTFYCVERMQDPTSILEAQDAA